MRIVDAHRLLNLFYPSLRLHLECFFHFICCERYCKHIRLIDRPWNLVELNNLLQPNPDTLTTAVIPNVHCVQGYMAFTTAIRKVFTLPRDSELNITFTCDEPLTGEKGNPRSISPVTLSHIHARHAWHIDVMCAVPLMSTVRV